jgi:hypothetical protein
MATLHRTRKVLGWASFLVNTFMRSTKLRAMLKVGVSPSFHSCQPLSRRWLQASGETFSSQTLRRQRQLP